MVCIDNGNYKASLQLRKIYEVLPDLEAAREGMIRVIDDSGEDYLYEADRFVPVELVPSAKRALLAANG